MVVTMSLLTELGSLGSQRLVRLAPSQKAGFFTKALLDSATGPDRIYTK